ncbi:hypothetical protein [Halapricum sp. CBA1109]|uniref:hypothetical protein n=1 Tax=Halapricum sp. CBA1109 TaxID=2668068 RepID=UPI00351AFAAC
MPSPDSATALASSLPSDSNGVCRHSPSVRSKTIAAPVSPPPGTDTSAVVPSAERSTLSPRLASGPLAVVARPVSSCQLPT